MQKNDDDLEGLLNTIKWFRNDIVMQFRLYKWAKVENITLHINTEITELKYNKIYKYLKVNETNEMNIIEKK